MTGLRLLIGAIVMGVMVPVALFFLLHLSTAAQLLTTSATCFLTWGVTDLAAGILSRSRLHHRSPTTAIRDWETAQRDEAQD